MKFQLGVLFAAPALLLGQTPAKPAFSEPAIDPDRQEIAFVSGGGIWRVPFNGGEASLLVSSQAYDSRPLYSPDGKYLAFESTRTGNGDIYLLTLATGELKRLTYDDAPEHLDAWSRDSQWLYFSSSSKDLFGMSDVFRVPVTGGTPMPVAADRYASEYFAAPSPDGKTIAITARGIVDRQWWRKGHSHLDQSEIWMVKPGLKPTYERVSDGGAKEMWPMWAPDGKTFYFVSDRDGAQNLWRQPVGGTSRPVTTFKDGRVLWPNLSYDGKTIVFERDFAIWKTETGNGRTGPLRISLHGAIGGQTTTHVTLNTFTGMALSPDGKKVALIAHGEVFAASAKTGGDAQRVTRTDALEDDVLWAPDSRRIVYLSDRSGSFQIFQYDFSTQQETRLTNSTLSDSNVRFSPDGKKFAFVRGGRELMVYDLEAKKERSLAKADMGRQPLVRDRPIAWSPDNKWVAFLSGGPRGFTNVQVVPEDGSATPRSVSFLANSFSDEVAWSPDGTFLLFDTSQRTEQGDVARVDLILRTPKFREDEFRDLFKPTALFYQGPAADTDAPKAPAPAKAETKPVRIVWDGIRERLRMLPLGLDASSPRISADGKTVVVRAVAARQLNLYSMSLEENTATPPVARQITSTPGVKSNPQFSPDGKELYYLDQGRVQIATLETRTSRPLAVNAEMDVDFQQEKMEVFREAHTYQRDHFFDDKFNGVDWDAARRQYEPFAAGSRTPTELYRVINLMLGELNASHSGIGPPMRNTLTTTGRLGLRFDPLAYEQSGKLVVTEVIPLGPSSLGDGVKVGDELQAVDGTAVRAGTNLDELLDRKIGKRVELKLGDRTVVVLPVNLTTEKRLLYRSWVAGRRAAVDKLSGGKLGYVHLPDMSSQSLTQFYIDLDADNQSKEGVVVDVRNNSGGFVNVYAIDVLARRPYLTMLERGRTNVPARSALGQRSLELPTILLTNQHSLSDAEDFTEGYRRLKLGKVVGEPTAGWIVYTWNHELIDGSSLRMPRVKVFDGDGQLMEMHPRPVDIPVDRPMGESYTGGDVQLETAVKELLAQPKQ